MVDVEENDTGVFVFENLDACSAELTKELEKYPYEVIVLGLDCEWVSRERKDEVEESPVCPVALLQLAFPHGRCFLIRLCQMNARLPDKLRDILEDRNILKTGVGIGEDAKKLSSCYGLVVQGCVDLRHVASRCRGYLQYSGGEGGTRIVPSRLCLSTLQDMISILKKPTTYTKGVRFGKVNQLNRATFGKFHQFISFVREKEEMSLWNDRAV